MAEMLPADGIALVDAWEAAVAAHQSAITAMNTADAASRQAQENLAEYLLPTDPQPGERLSYVISSTEMVTLTVNRDGSVSIEKRARLMGAT